MWAVTEEQTGGDCSVCHLPLSLLEAVRLDPTADATDFHDGFFSLWIYLLKTCKFIFVVSLVTDS